MLGKYVELKKADDDLQVVYGEVYVPNFPDSQGEFMSAETVRDMAWDFLRRGSVTKIDVQHDRVDAGCFVVESFIARDGDDTFIPGSWVLGVHIPSKELWGLVKSGELNGFSLDGFAVGEKKTLTIEIPELLKGETDEVEGHTHEFFANYDPEGNFIGGFTSKGEDGHVHAIASGTVTEYAGEPPHRHKFSFVEGILSAQI